LNDELFIVESTFRIEGLGLVLLPGVSLEQYGSVQAGDSLLIQRPDGSITETIVRGVEYPPSIKWVGEKPVNPRYGVLVDLDDVPAGSVATLT
jgi:hypothetical protein